MQHALRQYDLKACQLAGGQCHRLQAVRDAAPRMFVHMACMDTTQLDTVTQAAAADRLTLASVAFWMSRPAEAGCVL